MDFDFRIVIVLLPLILAGGWAVYNIGAVALRQVQNFLNKQTWSNSNIGFREGEGMSFPFCLQIVNFDGSASSPPAAPICRKDDRALILGMLQKLILCYRYFSAQTEWAVSV